MKDTDEASSNSSYDDASPTVLLINSNDNENDEYWLSFSPPSPVKSKSKPFDPLKSLQQLVHSPIFNWKLVSQNELSQDCESRPVYNDSSALITSNIIDSINSNNSSNNIKYCVQTSSSTLSLEPMVLANDTVETTRTTRATLSKNESTNDNIHSGNTTSNITVSVHERENSVVTVTTSELSSSAKSDTSKLTYIVNKLHTSATEEQHLRQLQMMRLQSSAEADNFKMFQQMLKADRLQTRCNTNNNNNSSLEILPIGTTSSACSLNVNSMKKTIPVAKIPPCGVQLTSSRNIGVEKSGMRMPPTLTAIPKNGETFPTSKKTNFRRSPPPMVPIHFVPNFRKPLSDDNVVTRLKKLGTDIEIEKNTKNDYAISDDEPLIPITVDRIWSDESSVTRSDKSLPFLKPIPVNADKMNVPVSNILIGNRFHSFPPPPNLIPISSTGTPTLTTLNAYNQSQRPKYVPILPQPANMPRIQPSQKMIGSTVSAKPKKSDAGKKKKKKSSKSELSKLAHALVQAAVITNPSTVSKNEQSSDNCSNNTNSNSNSNNNYNVANLTNLVQSSIPLQHSTKIEKSQQQLPVVANEENCTATIECASNKVKSSIVQIAAETACKNVAAKESLPKREYVFSNKEAVQSTVLPNGRKLYSCDVCNGVYHKMYSLKKHFFRNHINPLYVSEKDAKKFDIVIPSAINSASSDDLIFAVYKCNSCDVAFSGKDELRSHLNNHSPSNGDGRDRRVSSERYPCDNCNVIFSRKKLYARHLTECPGSAENKCKITKDLDDDDTNGDSLSGDLMIELKDELPDADARKEEDENLGIVMMCLFCELTFTSSECRKKHVMKYHHPKRKQQQCEYCKSKKFIDLNDLLRHICEVHSKKYFGCAACKVRFKSKVELIAHNAESHTADDKTASKVAVVDDKAKQLTNNSTSTTKKTATSKTYKCNRCSKVYTNNTDLTRHRKSAHRYAQVAVNYNSGNSCESYEQKYRSTIITAVDYETEFYRNIAQNVRRNLDNFMEGRLHVKKNNDSRSVVTVQMSANRLDLLGLNDTNEDVIPLSIEDMYGADNCNSRFIQNVSRLHLATQITMLRKANLLDKSLSSTANMIADRVSSLPYQPEGLVSTLHPQGERVTRNDVAFNGEWIRTRCYICAACFTRFNNFWEIEDHRWNRHPNVWGMFYEFITEETPEVNWTLKRSFHSIGSLKNPSKENKLVYKSRSSVCAKCHRTIVPESEFHKHILECGGDTTWMLKMYAPHSMKRNKKYKPYSNRKRKNVTRVRGLKRNIPTTPIKIIGASTKSNSRQKAGDTETIQRMIANLPPKRITRRVFTFDETEAKMKNGHNNTYNNNIVTRRRKVQLDSTSSEHIARVFSVEPFNVEEYPYRLEKKKQKNSATASDTKNLASTSSKSEQSTAYSSKSIKKERNANDTKSCKSSSSSSVITTTEMKSAKTVSSSNTDTNKDKITKLDSSSGSSELEQMSCVNNSELKPLSHVNQTKKSAIPDFMLTDITASIPVSVKSEPIIKEEIEKLENCKDDKNNDDDDEEDKIDFDLMERADSPVLPDSSVILAAMRETMKQTDKSVISSKNQYQKKRLPSRHKTANENKKCVPCDASVIDSSDCKNRVQKNIDDAEKSLLFKVKDSLCGTLTRVNPDNEPSDMNSTYVQSGDQKTIESRILSSLTTSSFVNSNGSSDDICHNLVQNCIEYSMVNKIHSSEELERRPCDNLPDKNDATSQVNEEKATRRSLRIKYDAVASNDSASSNKTCKLASTTLETESNGSGTGMLPPKSSPTLREAINIFELAAKAITSPTRINEISSQSLSNLEDQQQFAAIADARVPTSTTTTTARSLQQQCKTAVCDICGTKWMDSDGASTSPICRACRDKYEEQTLRTSSKSDKNRMVTVNDEEERDPCPDCQITHSGELVLKRLCDKCVSIRDGYAGDGERKRSIDMTSSPIAMPNRRISIDDTDMDKIIMTTKPIEISKLHEPVCSPKNNSILICKGCFCGFETVSAYKSHCDACKLRKNSGLEVDIKPLLTSSGKRSNKYISIDHMNEMGGGASFEILEGVQMRNLTINTGSLDGIPDNLALKKAFEYAPKKLSSSVIDGSLIKCALKSASNKRAASDESIAESIESVIKSICYSNDEKTEETPIVKSEPDSLLGVTSSLQDDVLKINHTENFTENGITKLDEKQEKPLIEREKPKTVTKKKKAAYQSKASKSERFRKLSLMRKRKSAVNNAVDNAASVTVIDNKSSKDVIASKSLETAVTNETTIIANADEFLVTAEAAESDIVEELPLSVRVLRGNKRKFEEMDDVTTTVSDADTSIKNENLNEIPISSRLRYKPGRTDAKPPVRVLRSSITKNVNTFAGFEDTSEKDTPQRVDEKSLSSKRSSGSTPSTTDNSELILDSQCNHNEKEKIADTKDGNDVIIGNSKNAKISTKSKKSARSVRNESANIKTEVKRSSRLSLASESNSNSTADVKRDQSSDSIVKDGDGVKILRSTKTRKNESVLEDRTNDNVDTSIHFKEHGERKRKAADNSLTTATNSSAKKKYDNSIEKSNDNTPTNNDLNFVVTKTRRINTLQKSEFDDVLMPSLDAVIPNDIVDKTKKTALKKSSSTTELLADDDTAAPVLELMVTSDKEECENTGVTRPATKKISKNNGGTPKSAKKATVSKHSSKNNANIAEIVKSNLEYDNWLSLEKAKSDYEVACKKFFDVDFPDDHNDSCLYEITPEQYSKLYKELERIYTNKKGCLDNFFFILHLSKLPRFKLISESKKSNYTDLRKIVHNFRKVATKNRSSILRRQKSIKNSQQPTIINKEASKNSSDFKEFNSNFNPHSATSGERMQICKNLMMKYTDQSDNLDSFNFLKHFNKIFDISSSTNSSSHSQPKSSKKSSKKSNSNSSIKSQRSTLNGWKKKTEFYAAEAALLQRLTKEEETDENLSNNFHDLAAASSSTPNTTDPLVLNLTNDNDRDGSGTAACYHSDSDCSATSKSDNLYPPVLIPYLSVVYNNSDCGNNSVSGIPEKCADLNTNENEFSSLMCLANVSSALADSARELNSRKNSFDNIIPSANTDTMQTNTTMSDNSTCGKKNCKRNDPPSLSPIPCKKSTLTVSTRSQNPKTKKKISDIKAKLDLNVENKNNDATVNAFANSTKTDHFLGEANGDKNSVVVNYLSSSKSANNANKMDLSMNSSNLNDVKITNSTTNVETSIAKKKNCSTKSSTSNKRKLPEMSAVELKRKSTLKKTILANVAKETSTSNEDDNDQKDINVNDKYTKKKPYAPPLQSINDDQNASASSVVQKTEYHIDNLKNPSTTTDGSNVSFLANKCVNMKSSNNESTNLTGSQEVNCIDDLNTTLQFNDTSNFLGDSRGHNPVTVACGPATSVAVKKSIKCTTEQMKKIAYSSQPDAITTDFSITNTLPMRNGFFQTQLPENTKLDDRINENFSLVVDATHNTARHKIVRKQTEASFLGNNFDNRMKFDQQSSMDTAWYAKSFHFLEQSSLGSILDSVNELLSRPEVSSSCSPSTLSSMLQNTIDTESMFTQCDDFSASSENGSDNNGLLVPQADVKTIYDLDQTSRLNSKCMRTKLRVNGNLCQLCQRTFSDINSLQVHVANIHSNGMDSKYGKNGKITLPCKSTGNQNSDTLSKPHRCNHCLAVLQTKSECLSHMKDHWKTFFNRDGGTHLKNLIADKLEELLLEKALVNYLKAPKETQQRNNVPLKILSQLNTAKKNQNSNFWKTAISDMLSSSESQTSFSYGDSIKIKTEEKPDIENKMTTNVRTEIDGGHTEPEGYPCPICPLHFEFTHTRNRHLIMAHAPRHSTHRHFYAMRMDKLKTENDEMNDITLSDKNLGSNSVNDQGDCKKEIEDITQRKHSTEVVDYGTPSPSSLSSSSSQDKDTEFSSKLLEMTPNKPFNESHSTNSAANDSVANNNGAPSTICSIDTSNDGSSSTFNAVNIVNAGEPTVTGDTDSVLNIELSSMAIPSIKIEDDVPSVADNVANGLISAAGITTVNSTSSIPLLPNVVSGKNGGKIIGGGKRREVPYRKKMSKKEMNMPASVVKEKAEQALLELCHTRFQRTCPQ